MNLKEKCYSIITFYSCKALTNKILAIIFSFIKLGLYLAIFMFLKNWNKETKKLEFFYISKFFGEIIILFTSIFLLVFSKYLNRKCIYMFIRKFTAIIIIYLFFSCFIDMYIFASIKFKEFPDLYSLAEDPIFNYKDDILSFSLEKFFIKGTKIIDISKIDDDIFKYTHLIKNNSKIFVSDPDYFKINFTDKSQSDLKPYQKRHRFEFNIPMILQLADIILDILSFFLWKSIRFKHKKLVQNSVLKIYGKKIIYAGYGRTFLFFTISHDEYEEEKARNEIRSKENYISEGDIEFSCLTIIMELISYYGALIVFIILNIKRNIDNYTTKALHFPFTLTFFGKGLYRFLLIFLLVNYGIHLLFLRRIDIMVNHHANIDKYYKQCTGGFLLFTIGLAYLFISICGIFGTLFLIAVDIDSNGNLYIKTACKDSDISCYNLFQFASNFPFDNRNYSKIFYYINIKKISKRDQAKNMASLISILLIYFSQFYIILFDKILDFNCDMEIYGKCVVHNITECNSEFLLLDNINANFDSSDKCYKNTLNDSYFKPVNNK